MMNCPKCSAAMPDDSVFCAFCGAKMERKPVPKPIVSEAPISDEQKILKELTSINFAVQTIMFWVRLFSIIFVSSVAIYVIYLFFSVLIGNGALR